MSQSFFYVSHAGQELGPFSYEDVQNKYSKKELGDFDFVYVEEKEDWLGLVEFLAWMQKEKSNRTTEPVASAPIHEFEIAIPTESPAVASQAPTPLTLFSSSPTTSSEIQAPCPVESAQKHEFSSLPTAPKKTVAHNPPASHLIIELDSLQAGNFQLQIQSLQGDRLVREVQDIHVRPGFASQIVAQVPEVCIAGEALKFHWRALDKFGTLADDFHGKEQFAILNSTGEKLIDANVQFQAGIAQTECRLTKAEKVQVKQQGQGLEFKQSLFVTVQPAAVFKFALEVPKEVRAGEKVQVRVVGIDQYGNTVENLPENPQVQVVNAMGEPTATAVGIQLHEVQHKIS